MRTGLEGSRFEANGEAAARAIFLKMPPWKWRLVCAFEGVLRLILPMLPARASQASPAHPRTILVVEYWNLGDLAILVPFLRNLTATGPLAQICLPVHASVTT